MAHSFHPLVDVMNPDHSDNRTHFSGTDRRRDIRRQDDRELRQKAFQFEAAKHLCDAFFQHHRVDDLIETVLHKALDVVDAEAGSILLADYDAGTLVFKYVVGEKADMLQGIAFPWDRGIAGSVFKSGIPEVIGDVKGDARHFPGVDMLTGYVTRNMVTMPLKKWEGEPLGVMNVLNKRRASPDENDLAVLTIVSAVATIAIQQTQLFEQAKKAEVLNLLGDLGHDLKNLLQPIVSGTDFLKSEVGSVISRLPDIDHEQMRESLCMCEQMINTVQSTSRRIQHRMLQVAECVKGLSASPRFAACTLSDVTDHVFKILKVIADEKKVCLHIEGVRELPVIMADEQRLFDAFYNLVNNAIEASPCGTVTIRGSVDQTADMVQLTVSDTGKGMSPEIRKSLFTSRPISDKRGGIGLGIKIVKNVVDAHKGHITVDSEQGQGTAFTIRLPIDPLRTQTKSCGE